MKIVINRCFGGFGLSNEAVLLYCELAGINLSKHPEHESTLCTYWITDSGKLFFDYELDRTDPILIKVVEELGEKANGLFAHLVIVEVPDGVRWELREYDGNESIEETHRSWS